MKKLSFAVAIALTFGSSAIAADADLVSTEGFGCLDQANFERAVTFANQDDMEAFEKFIRSEISKKSCRLIHVGDAVYVEKVDMKGSICVRPKGEIDCYWTGETLIN